MRETVRSLRFYFLLVGGIDGVAAVAKLTKPMAGTDFIYLATEIAGALLCLYLALRLQTLLANTPRQAEYLVWGLAALIVVNGVANMVRSPLLGLATVVVPVAVFWYLLGAVRRLGSSSAADSGDKS